MKATTRFDLIFHSGYLFASTSVFAFLAVWLIRTRPVTLTGPDSKDDVTLTFAGRADVARRDKVNEI
jgi:hypothetical protein